MTLLRPASATGLLALVLVLVAATGCGVQNGDSGSESSSSSSSSSPPARTAPADGHSTPQQPTGGATQLGGISFAPVEGWNDLGANGMRKAVYQHPPVEGDTEAAEITVFYFGPDQGGTIESNIQRWIGQMQTADGGDATANAVRSKLTTGNGLDVHFVEVDGTYMMSMGGGPMTGGRKKAMPGYRMVGAIVEAPQGNVFFKLVGPSATAEAMEEGMRKMLDETTKV